ncbi:MAG: zinc ribbon domain-containing protein [Candidatus Thorarchaeota archaeon]
MPKRSKLNVLTWIFTELVIGLGLLVYGLSATIIALPEINVVYIVLASIGICLLLVSIIQILIYRKKKVKKFCSKCGEKIKKDDEFCSKCGEKVE